MTGVEEIRVRMRVVVGVRQTAVIKAECIKVSLWRLLEQEGTETGRTKDEGRSRLSPL